MSITCGHCAACCVPLVDKAATYWPATRQRKTLAFWDKVQNAIYTCGTDAIGVRSVCYLLETLRVIGKSDKEFTRVERAISDMRRAGLLPYARIAESHRERLAYDSYDNLADFLATVQNGYERNLWQSQPRHVEVWLEKDGLARLVEPVCVRYRFLPVVTKGRPSLTLLHKSARELRTVGKPISLLYLGDLDPSGVDSAFQVEHDLRCTYGVPDLEVVRLAITRCQLDDPALGLRLHTRGYKAKDALGRAFAHLYGSENCVELDALPPAVLQRILDDAIRARIDWALWDAEQEREGDEQRILEELIARRAWLR